MQIYTRWFSRQETATRRSRTSQFAEMVCGHKFVAIARCKVPKGKYIKCDSCGGRATFYVLLCRDDNQLYRFGKTCLCRVGLSKAGIAKEPGRGILAPIFLHDCNAEGKLDDESLLEERKRILLRAIREKEKENWGSQAGPDGYIRANHFILPK